jgi:hypothetical protein
MTTQNEDFPRKPQPFLPDGVMAAQATLTWLCAKMGALGQKELCGVSGDC